MRRTTSTSVSGSCSFSSFCHHLRPEGQTLQNPCRCRQTRPQMEPALRQTSFWTDWTETSQALPRLRSRSGPFAALDGRRVQGELATNVEAEVGRSTTEGSRTRVRVNLLQQQDCV